ncbi:MAG: macro domain-containing protein [Eubacterium sp.]|nr:macro domain-containing protein [Candidatus Colimonas fimequi]
MSLTIIRNDITKTQVDAIVNTANRQPTFGRGTDSAVYHAAGVRQLMEARSMIGQMQPGQVAITEGFELPAKYIIHVVGTKWRGGAEGEVDIIRSCYSKALQCAYDMECSSIAIPLLASGTFGFPKSIALALAMSEIRKFLAEHEIDVYLVVFDDESVKATEDVYGKVESYIDENLIVEQEICARESFVAEESVSYGVTADNEPVYFDESEYMESETSIGIPVVGGVQPQANMAPKAELSITDAKKAELEKQQTKVTQKRHSIFGWKKTKRSETRSLDELRFQVSESFADKLQRLIDGRLLDNPWVYTNACMSKQTFNKIINGQSVPKKNTVLILAITLKLNLDETVDLLARAGHALSPSSLSDTIIKYFIENGIYEWEEIDETFVHFDLAPLVQVP